MYLNKTISLILPQVYFEITPIEYYKSLPPNEWLYHCKRPYGWVEINMEMIEKYDVLYCLSDISLFVWTDESYYKKDLIIGNKDTIAVMDCTFLRHPELKTSIKN
jgi:hypothetical protein